MNETVEGVLTEPVTEDEVDRAKTALLNGIQQQLSNSVGIALGLSEWTARGDWRLFFLHRDRIEAVTAVDVNRVAHGVGGGHVACEVTLGAGEGARERMVGALGDDALGHHAGGVRTGIPDQRSLLRTGGGVGVSLGHGLGRGGRGLRSHGALARTGQGGRGSGQRKAENDELGHE